jgi:hypothetical protein
MKNLPEINEELEQLPAKIARTEEELLLAEVDRDQAFNAAFLATEGAMPIRKSTAEISANKIDRKIAALRSHYHELYNTLETIIELARNKRQELKSNITDINDEGN